jgi:hypothetical protein
MKLHFSYQKKTWKENHFILFFVVAELQRPMFHAAVN